jgi:hypothetical protein
MAAARMNMAEGTNALLMNGVAQRDHASHYCPMPF